MRFTSVEALIDRAAHRVLDRLPHSGPAGGMVEFVVFGLKQAWACLFGGLMLAAMLGSSLLWPQHATFARYDALVVFALAMQLGMLALKLETLEEAKVIFLFHLVGTAMEIFKTGVGSWIYPEPSLLRVAGVPLFTGFMYGAVGSYLARVSRIFDFHFSAYPKRASTVLLAVAVYANFFTHHYVWDVRPILFAATALLYWRTVVHYRVFRFRHRMPLLLGFLLVALFIWLAENIGTFSRIWLYPGQRNGWQLVAPEKLGAWLLLMIISFVLVTLVHRPKPLSDAVDLRSEGTKVRPAPLRGTS